MSAILLLHRGRDDRGDRLEGANALVHRLARVGDTPFAAADHSGNDRGGPGEVLGVELQLDGERTAVDGLVPYGQGGGLPGRRADVGGGTRGVRQTAAYRDT